MFGVIFGQLLVSHMLYRKPDGLYSGGSTWGDLAWHLSMISNFVERGLRAVREDPIFPGTKLSYPFLPDLLSAWLIRHGVSLQTSLVAPTFLAALASVVALFYLALSITRSRLAAVVVPFIYFFNGSIVGCYYLWSDYRKSGRHFLTFLNNMPTNYAHVWEHNLRFSNITSDYVLPQRASVFGLLLGLMVVQLLWLYWQGSRRKHLFFAGLLLSFMPLIHFHSFVALVIAASLLSFTELLTDVRSWRRVFGSWMIFAVPLIAIAFPQTLWIAPPHTGHFFRWQLGWTSGTETLWHYWLKNLSPHLFVFALGYSCADRKLRSFYWAFCGLFLLTNIVVFQPHDYDNMKLLLWWFLVSCVLTGVFLAELKRNYAVRGLVIALLVTSTLMLSGTAAVYREMRLSWRMFSPEDIALASYVKEHSDRNAIFLTSDKHNNPVPCLAGRRIVMGYRGWLWTHGIDFRGRESDIMQIYSGRSNALELLREYRIDYVLLEKDKAIDFNENEAFFRSHFPTMYSSQNYLLFKVANQPNLAQR